MDRNKLRIPITLLILFIFVVNYIAITFHWYSAIHWLDMLMHFLGGFWLALALVFLFPPKDFSIKFAFHVILVVLFIGVVWEVFQISLNSITVKDTFDMIDTISDVIFDLLGGLGALAYLYFFKREKSDIINQQ